MQDKVSVIVPIYNVEQWLDDCVNSIVKQDYRNIEIILVDDGSTDNSGIICEEWKQKDERIIVIHKKNGGLSSARNAGLDICQGDYVTFVDSDDYIQPDTIQCMLKDIKEKKVEVVRCAMNKIIKGKSVESKDVYNEKMYLKNELLDGFYYYKEGLCGSVCDKLFKAELFEGLRFPEGINSEDYYALFNIFLKIDKMFYNNKCLYNYRIRDNSICTTQVITEHSFDKIKISDIIKEATEEVIPERLLDAENFQTLSRFFVYTDIICRDYTNFERKKWISELKKCRKKIFRSRNIDIKFKLKYFCFIYFTRIYTKIFNNN